MKSYYADRLYARRLEQVYHIAPPRVRQYLDAELSYVTERVRPEDVVLELGCGYGRILPRLSQTVRLVIGIDLSLANLLFGQERLHDLSNCLLLNMDAVELGFRDHVFDRVVCIQNGISAFHVNQRDLIRESLRVAKPGGTLFFSSYSSKFWEPRLQWFELQSDAGLLGPIDYKKTKDGVIVCKDGFTATTVGPSEFLSLVAVLNVRTEITEIDDSSIFYVLTPQTAA